MKGFLLWAAFAVFLWLAITAVNMGEYTIALAMAAISIGCLWAAPSGGKKKAAKSRQGADSGWW